ncbi:hypothetical protein BH24ACT26_BH24ACT26_18440 [soil metagenome]
MVLHANHLRLRGEIRMAMQKLRLGVRMKDAKYRSSRWELV